VTVIEYNVAGEITSLNTTEFTASEFKADMISRKSNVRFDCIYRWLS